MFWLVTPFKCTPVPNRFVKERKHARKEEPKYLASIDEKYQETVPKTYVDQRSSLTLEVISGPACRLHCTLESTNTNILPLTLGRVPLSDLVLKDSELSGKHAMISWNVYKLKWELVDMGSLNGTFLNSQAVCHPDFGSRLWSEPIDLASGDIIILGTASKVYVQITPLAECWIPFGVGMASDPTAVRQEGKKLAMEDVCYYQWPIPRVEQFGLFGICDGHGGAGAAKAASKVVLQQFFLVWADGHENFFAQCANVGDSACVMNIGGRQIKMTEDHRITSQSERTRFGKAGEPLKDGEMRLCGLNLGWMLGNKLLKEHDVRFSSEPYISEVVRIDKSSRAFALLASDGLWDVVGVKKVMQFILQTRERCAIDREDLPEKIVNFVLSEARTLRTKDNTSVIFLDFYTLSRTAACKVAS